MDLEKSRGKVNQSVQVEELLSFHLADRLNRISEITFFIKQIRQASQPALSSFGPLFHTQ